LIGLHLPGEDFTLSVLMIPILFFSSAIMLMPG
jgi:hypothetical protein